METKLKKFMIVNWLEEVFVNEASRVQVIQPLYLD